VLHRRSTDREAVYSAEIIYCRRVTTTAGGAALAIIGQPTTPVNFLFLRVNPTPNAVGVVNDACARFSSGKKICYRKNLGVVTMRTRLVHRYFYLAVIFLAGCAIVPKPQDNNPVGIDGQVCAGAILTPPKGLVPTDDPALLQAAQGPSGQGKLCAGRVFAAEQPVTVYRVWDSTRAYTVYGSWWSLDQPHGPRERYQKEEDICPEWSGLDRVTVCTIKPGTHVVIGPGQSADCKDGLTLPKSSANQVYIPNDSRNNQLFVENCTAGAEWPSAAQ
jgi:hypothetical protein